MSRSSFNYQSTEWSAKYINFDVKGNPVHPAVGHYQRVVPEAILKWIQRLVFIQAVFLSNVLFGQPQSTSEGESGIDVLRAAHDRHSGANSFVCDVTDNIRRQTTPYYFHKLSNGVVEESFVFSTKPLQWAVRNRQGFWVADAKEVVKREFGKQRQQFDFVESVLRLKTDYPSDVTIRAQGVCDLEGTSCQLVEASVSERVVRQLAERFRVQIKSSNKEKGLRTPNLDMLQFVPKRWVFSVGASDHLVYQHREYDGNGDLFLDLSFSNQELDGSIPDEVFAVPTGGETFIAHTPRQLQEHLSAATRQRQKGVWEGFARKSHGNDTNSPSGSGGDNAGAGFRN